MPNAKIDDVAKRAGVSRATVSRVLNNNPKVDADLRERVLEAAKDLGYQPNRAARRLRAQSSNVIGLVISDIQNPYFLSVTRGVEDAASAQQMSLILCNSDENLDKERMYLHVMEAERVAGLIIVPAHSDHGKDLNALKKAGIPIILMDRAVKTVQVDTLKVDNEHGAYEAVNHLIQLGYRRIATIAGSCHVSTGLERYQGYKSALESAGMALDDSLVKFGNFKTESGYTLAHDLMNTSNPPDAIFIANNLMTLGALQALRERSVRVPEDVALVGFDDLPWSGELYSPLTAVAQPTYEIGQEAVRLLLRRLANPKAPYQTVVLQPHLNVRESCGIRIRT
jgi:LacI family transcriptional regulator